PSLEDKIVQKATGKVLNAIYEQDFLECSYGFRPGGANPVRQKLASRPVASVAIRRVTGGCEAYTARKQAVKITIVAMPTSMKWRKAVSGTTAIAKGGPKSP